LHIDPTTIDGFIPEHMSVSGNLIEAKYVRQRIIDGNPIPRIPDPGSSFTTFQEQEKRNQVKMIKIMNLLKLRRKSGIITQSSNEFLTNG
jgi:hypothetical protein